MESILVTAGIDPSACHHYECECTVDLIQRILQCIDTRLVPVNTLFLDEMGKHLRVRSRLEKTSPVLEFFTQLLVVHDLSVVGQSEVARIVMKEERLDILSSVAAGIAVTHMTDGHVSWKQTHLLLVEHLGHETVTLDPVEKTFRVNSHDTAALLPPVLEGMQTVICQIRSIRHTINSKYTTLVMQFVVSITIITLTHMIGELCRHFLLADVPNTLDMTSADSITIVLKYTPSQPLSTPLAHLTSQALSILAYSRW